MKMKVFMVLVMVSSGIAFRLEGVALRGNPFPRLRGSNTCPVDKPGATNGEATMFQEDWVHGKTGACGYNRPNTKHAEGFFAAVGAGDWDEGFGCGTCAELSYQGRKTIVNVVDRCWGCSKGWFDMGGPAWRDLTGGAPPGHIHGVESRWIECPASLTGGGNLQIYVKPGSHPWDARFQPVANIAPVTKMSINAGSGWKEMKKCENFMFCKPGSIILKGKYQLRVESAKKSLTVQMSNIPEGQYVDMGDNNGDAKCDGSVRPVRPTRPSGSTTTRAPITTTTRRVPSGPGSCEKDGLFPDPDDCRGFIKCAQGSPYKKKCSNGLVFDKVTYNCNWPAATDCGSRPY